MNVRSEVRLYPTPTATRTAVEDGEAVRDPIAQALTGSIRNYRTPVGADLLKRTSAYGDWVRKRIAAAVWPYFRSTDDRPGCRTRLRGTQPDSVRHIVNFASQDYLSLSRHPEICSAASEAIKVFGVHSSGSAALMGRTRLSVDLESALQDFLGYRHVLLFPTGWAAGFGVIRGLVRPGDHVVIDALSHASLQEGASTATKNIHRHAHLDVASLTRLLARIRASDPDAGILVVTESLFSMDSDTPDLQPVHDACGEYGATLMVDCAHDLGCIGPGGGGHLALQGLTGRADLLMGSFSKTFASNGGFVATNSYSAYEYLKVFAGPWTFSNALSPVQCAVILASLGIVRSKEGDQRRAALMNRVTQLRAHLARHDAVCLGGASPIVPVMVGDEALARLASRQLADLGLGANLVEYPAVARGAARFRLQAMADHSEADVEFAARAIETALARAREELGREIPAGTTAQWT